MASNNTEHNANRPHRRGNVSCEERNRERQEIRRPKCSNCEERYSPEDKISTEPGICYQCEQDLGMA